MVVFLITLTVINPQLITVRTIRKQLQKKFFSWVRDVEGKETAYLS